MSALAVVQARMSSARLPGKVLADVAGEPMLTLLLARLRRAKSLADVVVATSIDPSDDPIAALADEIGVRCSRGSLDDVLGRIVEALDGWDGTVVRITADCPLVDPAIVDQTVGLLLATPGCAYASNIAPRAHPDGLDVEALRAAVLRELAETVHDARDREHVTLALRRDMQRWPTVSIPVTDERLGRLRWTVDHPGDLAFIRAVAARLGERAHEAGLDEILAAVRREPSLAEGGLRGTVAA